jgi:tetratricopeptide (TPR) repeat protein
MQANDHVAVFLPQLDQMTEALDSGQPDQVWELLEQIEWTLSVLYGGYLDELDFLAPDEPSSQIAERIGVQFSDITPLLTGLQEDLQNGEFDLAGETLEALREGSLQLYSLFEDYRRALQDGPRYSRIPYTQELLRVGHHYINHSLGLDPFHRRLDTFCQYHESLVHHLSHLTPSAPERATLEERWEDIEEALDLQAAAIEELDRALEQDDREAVKECLEVFADVSEALLDVHQALKKADQQPRTISCLRCRAPNSTQLRLCGQCGSVLPQNTSLLDPTTMRLEEDGTTVGTVEAQEVRKMQELVDIALQSGRNEPLKQALEDYGLRLQTNRRLFHNLQEPPSDLPQEQLNLIREARESFAQAFQELEKALELLNEGSDPIRPQLLESGLERMRRGAKHFESLEGCLGTLGA